MKTIILFLFVTFSSIATAQNLEKLLWDNVKECNESIKNSLEEDEMPENKSEIYEKLDFQLSNGYLSIAGTWPTCGCGCEATVAGFKDEKGNFTMLKYESWSCDDKFGVYASRKLEDVFPANFGLASFVEGENKLKLDGNSYFYLKAEVPAKGTNTAVSINVLPLGMLGKSTNGLSFNTDKTTIVNQNMYAVTEVLLELENAQQLDLILKKDFQKLPQKIQDLIEKGIKNNSIKSKEDFAQHATLINNYYQVYSQLSYTTMVLAWDKKAARFTIKSKGDAPEKMDFNTFLRTVESYSPKC